MDNNLYLIISIKNSTHKGFLEFYRANRSGYTSNVDLAGRYSRDEAHTLTHNSYPDLLLISESDAESLCQKAILIRNSNLEIDKALRDFNKGLLAAKEVTNAD